MWSAQVPKRGLYRGAALVELALILPILLILTFGMIEFGRAFFISHILATAAREGARRAVVTRSLAANQAQVTGLICNEIASAIANCSDVQIQITPLTTEIRRGDPVTVDLRYNLRLITGVVANLLGLPTAIPLRSTCTMRDEVSPR